jgi:maleylpyruvate isomerase
MDQGGRQPTLWGYWLSGAAHRVRIALELKGLKAEHVAIDLRAGAQHGTSYLLMNPQGLVPFFTDCDLAMGQSLAIIEYLDATVAQPPLLGCSAREAAAIRQRAYIIAEDVHPLNNLRLLKALREDFGAMEDQVSNWIARWIGAGFAALEAMTKDASVHLVGDTPSLADVCLVPQLYSARRFGVDLNPYPRLTAIGARLNHHPAFIAAVRELEDGRAPFGRLTAVDYVIRPERAKPIGLVVRRGGRDHPSAHSFGELQRKNRHATRPEHENGLILVELSVDHKRTLGRHACAGHRRGFGGAASLRCSCKPVCRCGDVFARISLDTVAGRLSRGTCGKHAVGPTRKAQRYDRVADLHALYPLTDRDDPAGAV